MFKLYCSNLQEFCQNHERVYLVKEMQFHEKSKHHVPSLQILYLHHVFSLLQVDELKRLQDLYYEPLKKRYFIKSTMKRYVYTRNRT